MWKYDIVLHFSKNISWSIGSIFFPGQPIYPKQPIILIEIVFDWNRQLNFGAVMGKFYY